MIDQKKRYLLWTIPLLLMIGCALCYVGAIIYPEYDSSPKEIFLHYLSYANNTSLVENAENIRADELSMGQGVYLRFEVDKTFVIEFLEYDQENSVSLHYPYKIVGCEEFYEAYADWADGWSGYQWWRPREIASSECYVTRGCEYFLIDQNSKLTYYYFFPDFLGNDYLCVED